MDDIFSKREWSDIGALAVLFVFSDQFWIINVSGS